MTREMKSERECEKRNCREMESENKVRRDCRRKNREKTARSLRREGAVESEIGKISRKHQGKEKKSWRKLDKVREMECER